MNSKEIGEILQTEINSALLTYENHNNDNGFLDCDILEFERGLTERNYEPVGICKNVPFAPDYALHSIGFCYRYNEELYWCHLTETLWYSLLSDVYGRNTADTIISEIMQYNIEE